MPHLNPAKGMVMSTDVGGGKAIIEIKNPKATLTIELSEDSGWVKMLPEGAIVTYTLDVELPRGVEPGIGPLPGDQIKTHEGIVTVPELAKIVELKPQNVAPDPEEIRKLHPIPGFNTVGINSSASGESMRDLLGLPSYAPDDGTTKTATATPSHN